MLFPFILLELARLIFMLAVFCVTMIMIKKAINLGLLITISCIGTFALCKFRFIKQNSSYFNRFTPFSSISSVFLGYLWSCVVSLFQIINVVHSSGYRGLHGDNPLKPASNKPTENVGKVKLHPSTKIHKDAGNSKPSANSDTNIPYPGGFNQSLRLKNDYIEMRRNYLKQHSFDIAHGHSNSRFWKTFFIISSIFRSFRSIVLWIITCPNAIKVKVIITLHKSP